MRSASRCLLIVSIAVAASLPLTAGAQSQVWNRTKIWNRETTLCPPPANSGPTLFATNGRGTNNPARQVRIPNYPSESAETVVTALRSLGLVPTSSTETSALPAGTFIRTVPAGGTCVDPESAVTVVASNGIPPRMPGTGWLPPRPPGGVWNPPQRLVMVPYFKSQPVQTVATALRRVGLSPGQEYSESSDLPAGTFTRTDPRAGTLVPRGSTVNIYESSGPREVMIPYFRAIPETRVVAALKKLGLGVGNEIQESSTLSAGTFTRTDPTGGTLVPLGSVVTVYYSSGPPPPPVQHWVIIPAFGAIPEREVVAALQSLGLNVRRAVPEASDLQAGTFTRTNPPAGTRVLEGSAVVVRYSRGPRPIVEPPVLANPPVTPPPPVNPVTPANPTPPASNPVQTPPPAQTAGQSAGKTPGNGGTYGGENPVPPPAGTSTAPRAPVTHTITIVHATPRPAAPPADWGSWLRPILYFLAGGIVAALGLMALRPRLAAKSASAAAAPTVDVSLARGGAKVANASRRGLILRCLLGPRDGPQLDIRRKP
jgi:beta-lactam-binding protein with PASTA domain